MLVTQLILRLLSEDLAWETSRDTLKHYVNMFGYILEVIVITDRMWG
jgi:hypothetical protein